MKRYELIVVGAGPAGLSAAIEAAKTGLSVAVFDENKKPGGQLFKQIHKFFGSKEHHAKVRGINIGTELLKEADELGVEVNLDATVIGLYQDKQISVRVGESVTHYKFDAIIIATGAAENCVTFPGWTVPGVIGAGAAQTMMNLHGVRPGKKILMLGTGNVGLVVGFQLLQAGCELCAIVDASPRVGGYGVHASKLARCGVPFYLSHTIVNVEGEDHVTAVTIAQVDASYNFIEGTEKRFEVDTVCLAVGLSPMSQLLKMGGCEMEDNPARGGQVPVIDEYGMTSVSGVYAAGDVSGIEEASSAMIEGRMAGICASAYLGYIDEAEKEEALEGNRKALDELRQGMFAPQNRKKKQTVTSEGVPISENLLHHGFISDTEIERFPGVIRKVGVHPVMECSQNIPCNPCQDVCSKGCIKIGKQMTSLPVVAEEATCTGCGMCVASCPGQAIFLLEEKKEETLITLPYEFLPLPKEGDTGSALDRSGKAIGPATVVKVRSVKAYDHTNLVTISVPKELGMRARFFKKTVKEEAS